MKTAPRRRKERWLLGMAAAAGYVGRFVLGYGTAITGVGALSYGAAQVYGPAGWMVLGTLLVADRVVDDHRAARRPTAKGGEQK